MAELPKLALARLRAKAADPSLRSGQALENRSGLPASGSPASQGVEHPDANLLAAFVEKSLTEKERAQVLSHLAECAGCREVVALALPAEAEVAETSGRAALSASPRVSGFAFRISSFWSVVRWGTMAAVLGTVAIVVTLHPELWRRPQPTSKEGPKSEVRSPLQPAPSRGVAPGEHASGAEAKGQVTLMASVRTPATTRGEIPSAPKAEVVVGPGLPTLPGQVAPAKATPRGGPTSAGEQAEKGPEITVSTVALPAPSPPPPAIPLSMSLSEAAAKQKEAGEMKAVPSALRATTQSVVVGGATMGGPTVEPRIRPYGAEATEAKAGPSEAPPPAVRMESQARTFKLHGVAQSVEVEASPPAALWSVSSTGNVRRSKDGGKTFEEVRVAQGVKFEAVAARGLDVWAGGTSGALFHSADGGTTWTRLDVGGNTETIVGIQVCDVLHLTITLTTGEQWTTEDGGQHWRQKP